jgi:hypothetical protein
LFNKSNDELFIRSIFDFSYLVVDNKNKTSYISLKVKNMEYKLYEKLDFVDDDIATDCLGEVSNIDFCNSVNDTINC